VFQVQILTEELIKTDQFSKFIKRMLPTIHKYLLISQTNEYYHITLLFTIWYCWNWQCVGK